MFSDSDSRYGSVSSSCRGGRGILLPWGAKERSPHPTGPCCLSDSEVRPGEFVMRTLFADFTVQAEKKIEAVMAEPQEKPLSKVLQRGEDTQFDQLLSAFGSVRFLCNKIYSCSKSGAPKVYLDGPNFIKIDLD